MFELLALSLRLCLEAVELLGGGASLEEAGHWRWAFGIHGLGALPVCSLLSDGSYNVSCSLVLLPSFLPYLDALCPLKPNLSNLSNLKQILPPVNGLGHGFCYPDKESN